MSDEEGVVQPEARGLTREALLRRGVAAGAVLGAGSLLGAAPALAAAKPKRGGTLRVGAPPSAPPFKAIDPHTNFGWSATLRIVGTYENLAVYDRNWKFTNVLAEQISWEKPLSWVVRLKPGIHFHNGKPLTADDVIYSIRRMVTQPGANSAKYWANVNLKAFRKLDQRTVRINLLRPDSTIADAFTDYSSAIVPVGFNPNKPNGTGPFKLTSLVPGTSSVQTANKHYWQHGLPYLDKVIIYDLSDPSARTNALLSGQVDAIAFVPLAQVSTVQGHGNLRILESRNGGNNAPIYMATTIAPFTDNRVRMAIKLIANRPQMVTDGLSGHGNVGNDIFSPNDAEYNHSLPQRHQDIAQAKSLLSAAGQSNLNVNLVVAEVQDGLTAACQVLAQNASQAGVTINVQKVDSSVLFGPQYLKWPFSVDFWGNRRYLIQVGASMVPGAVFNETHWPDPQDATTYFSLYRQARQSRSARVRTQIIHEMQKIDYDKGGYLLWSFNNKVDGLNTKVRGLHPTKSNVPLDRGNFGQAYLA
jgi:peptide/nickel transport system substrate-binding protein